jgi:serine/threonine-protein kinase
MSPEQARGEPIDARTDLWSMCVVLYESIMGTPPFDALNSNALLHAIATQAAPTLAGRGVCDGALSKIIDRGLSKTREERWRHARDLMLALAEWLRQQGVTDDITGLSLRGRGVGGRSSLPKALALGGEVAPANAKVNPNAATAVGLLRTGRGAEEEAEGADAARDDAAGGAFEAMALGTSPERRTRTLLWAGLGFIVLALGVLGGVVLRRPPTPRAERAAPVQPAAASAVASGGASPVASDGASKAPPAPTRPATPPPARESRAAPPDPAAERPETSAAAKPSGAREKPAGAAAEPRAKPARPKASPKPAAPKPNHAPGAFKNPFE